MSRAQRQDDKRATVAVGELCFARITRVDRHDRADLTKTQNRRLTVFDVLGKHV
jgi:hypothetical protein